MEMEELGDTWCSVQILSCTQVMALMGSLPLTDIHGLVQVDSSTDNMVHLH